MLLLRRARALGPRLVTFVATVTLGAIGAIGACADPVAPPSVPAAAPNARLAKTGTGGRFRVVANRVRYRDAGAKPVRVTGGTATVTTRALLDRQGRTTVQVIAGALDGDGYLVTPAGRLSRVQLKGYNPKGRLLGTENYNRTADDSASFVLTGLGPRARVQVSAHVRGAVGRGVEVVRVTDTVRLAPDLRVRLQAPRRAVRGGYDAVVRQRTGMSQQMVSWTYAYPHGAVEEGSTRNVMDPDNNQELGFDFYVPFGVFWSATAVDVAIHSGGATVETARLPVFSRYPDDADWSVGCDFQVVGGGELMACTEVTGVDRQDRYRSYTSGSYEHSSMRVLYLSERTSRWYTAGQGEPGEPGVYVDRSKNNRGAWLTLGADVRLQFALTVGGRHRYAADVRVPLTASRDAFTNPLTCYGPTESWFGYTETTCSGQDHAYEMLEGSASSRAAGWEE